MAQTKKGSKGAKKSTPKKSNSNDFHSIKSTQSSQVQSSHTKSSKIEWYGYTSLGLSILSLLFAFAAFIGIPMAIVAITFYFLQKKEKPMIVATIGLVIGIISIIVNLVVFATFGLFILYAFLHTGGDRGSLELINFSNAPEENFIYAIPINATTEETGLDEEWEYILKTACFVDGEPYYATDVDYPVTQDWNGSWFNIYVVYCGHGGLEVIYFNIDAYYQY